MPLKTVSVVIPVYNSEKTLEELYGRLVKVLPEMCRDFEIIMVDDGSADRSFERMQQLRKGDYRVKLIRLAGNFGQQNALLCGFRYATGDFLVTLDDDLQHPPEEIPKLYAKLSQGYEAVFGIPSANAKRHSRYRNLGSKLVLALLNRITAKPKTVKVSSFRALTREVYRQINNEQRSFIYLAPLIFQATPKIANAWVDHEPRKHGRSNYTLGKLLKLTLKLIVFYTKIGACLPLRQSPQYRIDKVIL
jgi:glycosyltransferase involved in cell wall biosynthesis